MGNPWAVFLCRKSGGCERSMVIKMKKKKTKVYKMRKIKSPVRVWAAAAAAKSLFVGYDADGIWGGKG